MLGCRAMKNQTPLLLDSLSQSSKCPISPLPQPSENPFPHLLTPSNLSSPSPSTRPNFPFPPTLLSIPSPPGCQPLLGNGLTRHPCFPVPLFSSTCLTSPLDPSTAHSFPHLFPSDCFCSLIFSSLPYGLCPPPPFLPPPTLPRYQVSQGNLISFKLLEVCWTFMSTFSI